MKNSTLFLALLLFSKMAFGQADSLRRLPPEKSKMFKIVDSLGVEHFEMMPQFPGGEVAMFSFVGSNMNYPKRARENGIQGRVIVSFIIEKDGELTEIMVKKSVGGGCDEEALRIMNLMPKWHPGWQDENPVRVKMNMPFVFKLESGRKKKKSEKLKN